MGPGGVEEGWRFGAVLEGFLLLPRWNLQEERSIESMGAN